MTTTTMRRKRYTSIATHVVLSIGALIMVGPFLWMLLTSLKTVAESMQVPPTILPAHPQWQNYGNVLSMLPFGRLYWNTGITTIAKVAGQLLLCSMAGFAFGRLRFRGRNVLFTLCLSLLMVPNQVFIIPNYLTMKNLGMLNTLGSLILPGMFAAMGTFFFRQFFMTLPVDLDEAAKLDGCNTFQIYWKILLPLCKPALIAYGILVTLWSWNDLMWPLIVINSPDRTTITAGLATLQGEYTTNYPVLMAGTVLAVVPLIALFMLLQRYFIEGIALSGAKG